MVQNAASKLNHSVEVKENNEIDAVDSWNHCKLVVLDASHIDILSRTIKRILSKRADLPIVVFSSAPGWKEAKEALLAGATDYQLKSSSDKELRKVLVHNLRELNHSESNV